MSIDHHHHHHHHQGHFHRHQLLYPWRDDHHNVILNPSNCNPWPKTSLGLNILLWPRNPSSRLLHLRIHRWARHPRRNRIHPSPFIRHSKAIPQEKTDIDRQPRNHIFSTDSTRRKWTRDNQEDRPSCSSCCSGPRDHKCRCERHWRASCGRVINS